MAKIRNTFNSGMIKDSLDSLQPSGSWRDMRNGVPRDASNFGVTNERGNELFSKIEGEIIGTEYNLELDSSFVFSKSKGVVFFSLVDHKTGCIESTTDKKLGCTFDVEDCLWITPEFKSSETCDKVNVYWSNGKDYFVFVIPEIFENQVEATCSDCVDSCDKYKHFPCKCNPTSYIQTTEGAGNTQSGRYTYALQTKTDGVLSNWTFGGKYVDIIGDNGIAGESSTKSIQIDIGCGDCLTGDINVALIRTIAGVTTVEVFDNVGDISSPFSFTYNGQLGVLSSLEEISVKRKTYLKGARHFQKDGRLYLYGLQNESNLDYQAKALGADVEFMTYKMTYQDYKKSGFPSIPRGENLMYGIVWNYCDGTNSAVFPFAPKDECDTKPELIEGDIINNIIQVDQGDIEFIPESNSYVFVDGPRDTQISTEEVINTAGELTPNDEILNPISEEVIRTSNCVLDPCKDITYKRNVVRRWKPGVKCTGLTYPDDTREDGTYHYGKLACKPIKLFTTPCDSEAPIMTSTTKGVRNKYQPGNDEFANTYVYPLGLRVSNIKFPSEEELPKPLCPNVPYRIVTIKRDSLNSTIISKGIVTPTFKGKVGQQEYVYPTHGISSFEKVDRFINDDGSRLGTDNDANGYIFNSLDTRVAQVPLNTSTFKLSRNLFGWGFRHGLYLKGEEPENEDVGRLDRLGARQTVNLNQSVSRELVTPVKGITYAPSDSVVSNPDGITYPLMNRYRESSIYMELQEPLTDLIKNGSGGSHSDSSFVGDTLDHCCPINGASSWYGTLQRDLVNQYGNIESSRYIDTGLIGKRGSESVCGMTGDVYIGPDTYRRTSYISDKVGTIFCTPCGERSVCQTNSGNGYELPLTGDVCDAKNWAGLHMTGESGTQTQNCLNLNISNLCTHTQQPGYSYTWTVVYTIDGGAPITMSQTFNNLNTEGIDQSTRIIEVECTTGFIEVISVEIISNDANSGPRCLGTKFGLIEEEIIEKEVVYCEEGETLGCVLASLTGETQSEFYFPRVLNTMVIYWGEFKTNPEFRQTGVGLQEDTALVYYPKTKDLGLDSTIDSTSTGMLSKFHYQLRQPSKNDEARADIYQEFLDIILPTLDADSSIEILETVYGDGSTFKLPCNTDLEGANSDSNIRGFIDNYDKYDYTFYGQNILNSFSSPPVGYDTSMCGGVSNEVYFSDQQIVGSPLDSYRNFKSNNYLTLSKSTGNLKKLFTWSGNVYAHTEESIWLIQYGNPTIASDIGGILLGGSDLLTNPRQIGGDLQQGLAGLSNYNHSITTEYGYYFVDEGAKRFYQFNGQLKEVSKNGMYNFFQNNIAFCGNCDCKGEKAIKGISYSLGWDPRHLRVMLTKKDQDECSSFTLSYDPIGTDGKGRWLGRHDYIPLSYVWDRRDMFTIKGNGLWKHNSEKFQTFYGKYYPFSVDFVAIDKNLSYIKHNGTSFGTEASINGVYQPRETFNFAAAWNKRQHTGLTPLNFITKENQNEYISDLNGKVQELEDMYKVSGLWDRANACGAITPIEECDCATYVEMPRYNDCGRLSKQSNKGTLMGSHLNYRLEYNNPNKDTTQILAKYVDTEYAE